ncbi:hypothetical protein OKW30_008261 [Paraburkholderia sp. Clong3]|uniref:hypothetical protein n=1 Tax=Paraburkholderia sp. Clong3 TaxID=2991061 RepID=UPI003D1C668F
MAHYSDTSRKQSNHARAIFGYGEGVTQAMIGTLGITRAAISQHAKIRVWPISTGVGRPCKPVYEY